MRFSGSWRCSLISEVILAPILAKNIIEDFLSSAGGYPD